MKYSKLRFPTPLYRLLLQCIKVKIENNDGSGKKEQKILNIITGSRFKKIAFFTT